MADIWQRYPCHSDQTTWQELGDETIILDVDSGVYYRVEGAGARVWQLADGAMTAEAIAQRITDEYEVGLEQARADLSELVAELVENGLLTCADSPARRPPPGA